MVHRTAIGNIPLSVVVLNFSALAGVLNYYGGLYEFGPWRCVAFWTIMTIITGLATYELNRHNDNFATAIDLMFVIAIIMFIITAVDFLWAVAP